MTAVDISPGTVSASRSGNTSTKKGVKFNEYQLKVERGDAAKSCQAGVCWGLGEKLQSTVTAASNVYFNPYPTAFPYGNGMVLHFYQQQESSTTKTVHRVINKGLKAYV